MTQPFLSVIVPAYQAVDLLPDTLGALASSALPRESWELIVVDDGSTDDTARVAAQFADKVVRLADGPRGPAHARNRGVEKCKGTVIVFVDADVRVHADVLDRIAGLFTADPGVAAAFGAYDDKPFAGGMVSRYRNLLHRYHHLRAAGDAETFWAGLGAVRKEVFAELNGFDEGRYRKPQIEDIELGRRMRRAGHRIVLDPAIQGTHLKRWTLRDLVVNDLAARGIPWMRLMLRERGDINTLNVSPREKICTALVGLSLMWGAAALVTGTVVLAAGSVLAILGVIGLNTDLYRFMARARSIPFAVGVLPLHLIYYMVSGTAVILGLAAHILTPEPGLVGEPSVQQVRKNGIER